MPIPMGMNPVVKGRKAYSRPIGPDKDPKEFLKKTISAKMGYDDGVHDSLFSGLGGKKVDTKRISQKMKSAKSSIGGEAGEEYASAYAKGWNDAKKVKNAKQGSEEHYNAVEKAGMTKKGLKEQFAREMKKRG